MKKLLFIIALLYLLVFSQAQGMEPEEQIPSGLMSLPGEAQVQIIENLILNSRPEEINANLQKLAGVSRYWLSTIRDLLSSEKHLETLVMKISLKFRMPIIQVLFNFPHNTLAHTILETIIKDSEFRNNFISKFSRKMNIPLISADFLTNNRYSPTLEYQLKQKILLASGNQTYLAHLAVRILPNSGCAIVAGQIGAQHIFIAKLCGSTSEIDTDFAADASETWNQFLRTAPLQKDYDVVQRNAGIVVIKTSIIHEAPHISFYPEDNSIFLDFARAVHRPIPSEGQIREDISIGLTQDGELIEWDVNNEQIYPN